MLTQNNTVNQSKSYTLSLVIIGALFFIFGFVTWTNGTLIPYLKIACQLKTDVQAYLVATAFFIAYTVMAIPSSLVLSKTGYKKGMSLGLFTMAIGAAIFIPAAHTRSYNLFLTGLFIIGTGLALLQTAANPYAAIIGPMESAASRISMMGICNKIAGILASLTFGYIALNDADNLVASLKTMDEATKIITLDNLAARVVMPYTIITGVLILLAVAILFSPLPDIKDTEKEADNEEAVQQKSIFQYSHLWLGVLALFLYVGVEVMAGDTIISYGKSLGIPLATAKYFTSCTLVCMLVGYLVGIAAIPKYISQQSALKWCALLGTIFTVAATLFSGYYSVLCIALLGLANSLMWPAIFPLAIDGLGKHTKLGSAFLIMAIAGGALLPLLYGKLSETFGTQNAYLLMAPCYLYIFYYGLKGYKK